MRIHRFYERPVTALVTLTQFSAHAVLDARSSRRSQFS
jgi:hypothetical protein